MKQLLCIRYDFRGHPANKVASIVIVLRGQFSRLFTAQLKYHVTYPLVDNLQVYV